MERSLWNTLALPLLQVFASRAKVISQTHEPSSIFLSFELLGIHELLDLLDPDFELGDSLMQFAARKVRVSPLC